MSPRQPSSRQRVVAAAAEMLARHGLNATSIRETVKRAEAPFGSTYHHFPGGKQQVVSEAVHLAGGLIQHQLEEQLRGDLRQGLSSFLWMWRERLVRSDFRVGCPVLAAAAEEPIDGGAEAALDAAAQVFRGWEAALAAALLTHGHAEESAALQLATLIVASLEGAVVLCRAERSIAPFDRVTLQVIALAVEPSAAR
ncbi:TetR/AcrR family transcriptional regulator [Pseudomonas aeruginosa]|nr:TetR/AcrR family transcriptional regulator [Pseudomonas aeruginosa]TEO19043.1 TetR/AcrR family transcriptional regulator [Pseudomonas aeruginosa]TEO21269.1 TetR/AcrR family transcriptional regulator [Pseudomonas aeruginosa]TEO25769.1 TetR/AcrR family transcriptional regulator [Pseudomonas aeruginosa]TEO42465.1 TetR/AcrR family transcriptional regulator [Pseudomonas aeruginosa]